MAVVDDKGREKRTLPGGIRRQILAEERRSVEGQPDPARMGSVHFSILTEVTGTVHFKTWSDGLTMQERVDEVTAWSQLVVVDSPDEKRQPQIIMRPEGASWARVRKPRKYLMPDACPPLVHDGDEVHAGGRAGQDPARNHQDQGHHRAGLPRVWSCSKPQAARDGIIAESTAWWKYGEVSKGHAQISWPATMASSANTLPRASTSTFRRASVKAGEPLMDGPRNPTTSSMSLGEKELQK